MHAPVLAFLPFSKFYPIQGKNSRMLIEKRQGEERRATDTASLLDLFKNLTNLS